MVTIGDKTFTSDISLQSILTYQDFANNEWHLLMPNEVRESLAESYTMYLKMAENGKKGPTPKELRHWSMMKWLYGSDGDAKEE